MIPPPPRSTLFPYTSSSDLGETDYSGRITKVGDASVREALYQAAHIMLTKPVKNCSQLKSWAMRVARRAGPRKAKVRSEEHTSELQSRQYLVCRLLLEKKKK